MISCDAKYFGREEERAGRTTSHSVRIRLWVSERGARISSFALFRITRSLVRRAKNTAGAFHSKNEKPFAHGCKSAKNQLRSADMFCGLELICDTFAWYFRVSHYCVTTSIDLWTDHACFYCLLKLLLRLLFLLKHFSLCKASHAARASSTF